MRFWLGMLLCSTGLLYAASIGADPRDAVGWERLGRSRFVDCEYKQATHAFEKALKFQPDDAGLHFWLGKSYARWADISSPLTAPKRARLAQRSLERAVELAPGNREYTEELFIFYVDSPEWFHGGLEKAQALQERFSPEDLVAEPYERDPIAESRKEHSGAGWWMRWAVLRTSGTLGHFIPAE